MQFFNSLMLVFNFLILLRDANIYYGYLLILSKAFDTVD